MVAYMKRVVWFVLPFFFAVASCEDCDPGFGDSTACSVENPVEELPWLRNEIASREQRDPSEFTQYFYIAQTEYRGETVFVDGNCCPTCNTVVPVLNCEGELIGLLGYGEENEEDINYIDFSILERATIIWKPKGGTCALN